MVAMAGLLLAGPAAAQEASHAADRTLAPMVACRGIADSAQRAACYDGALNQLQGRVTDRQVVIVDHEQVKQDRRTLFGFGPAHKAAEPKAPPPPKLAKAARGSRAAAPTEDLREIDSTVASASSNGEFWIIRLATGATWRTTEASNITVAPRAGTKVHIHKSPIGSFFMRIGNARAVRAVRTG